VGVRAGLLVAPVHGVLYAAQLTDSLELRLACLRLVVPENAVVTDRTAAWLHGAPMVLQPNAHLRLPPLARSTCSCPQAAASDASSCAAVNASSSPARSRRSATSA
jgi:hypothetical protein